MAKKFENTFQWSHTRARAFQLCKRYYYYAYYGYWGGWDPNAPPEARTLYLLKKMTTIPMWTGSVVHRCIEQAIRSARAGTVVSAEELKVMAMKLLAGGWMDSRNGGWRTDPKKSVNLAEHYYRRPLDDAEIGSAASGVLASLNAFHRSAVYRHLCAHPGSVLAVEEMMTFPVGGVPVVMVADLAVAVGDECHIYDWKSGGVAPLAADQLSVYALGAMTRWGYTQEKVRLFVAYLAEETVQEVACTSEDLLKIRGTIAGMAAAMLAYCQDAGSNVPKPKRDFPLCGKASVCASCVFRQACQSELAAEEDKSFFLALQKTKEAAFLPPKNGE